MSIELSINAQNIELDTTEQGVIPIWAAIGLTLSGMPASLCSYIRPDDRGRLRLYPRDSSKVRWAWSQRDTKHLKGLPRNPNYDRSVMQDDFAWDGRILPALEKHLNENWNTEARKRVTEAVNSAVYTLCNAALEQIDWQGEYELDTPEQCRAASILQREGSLASGNLKIRVDRGHATIVDDGYTIFSMPITPDVARRVHAANANMTDGIICHTYPAQERTILLIGAILSAHPALELRGSNTQEAGKI